MRIVSLLGLFLSGASLQAQPRYDEPKDVTQLWSGFDTTTLPSDIEVKDEWEDDGVHLRKLYFTSEVWEGEPVRVFAYVGIPSATEKGPGILHIHGGGQTANLEWVRFWTKRGYGAASFDWCGKWQDRSDYTRWGRVKGDMATYGNAKVMSPSVRYAAWYHWAIAARRTLTLLASEPNIDSSRLGVFGISMGAKLAWIVAGTDPRVKTAVPIYGCGWNTYPDVHSGGGHHHPVPPEIDLWRATIEPETYARYITCPLLLLSCTNDFYTNMDRCYDSLARVGADTRQSFTLRYSHHLEPAQGRNLPLWMDSQLRGGKPWARSPKIGSESSGGDLVVNVTPDEPEHVTAVGVAYAVGDKRPQARFWRSLGAVLNGERWHARAPVVDVNLPIRVICDVTYAEGYTLTSAPHVLIPSSMGIVAPTDEPSLIIDDFEQSLDDWAYGAAYTDPYTELEYLRQTPRDAHGLVGLTLNPAAWGGETIDFTFGTHKVGDPKWEAPANGSLSFRCRTAAPTTLEVHAVADHWGPQQKEYVAVLSPESSSEWQEFLVTAAQCAAPDGSKLPGWHIVDRLDFKGTSPPGNAPVFTKIEWRVSESGSRQIPCCQPSP